MGNRDTWTDRDLPVLKAVVDIFEESDGDGIYPNDIRRRTGFDGETVQRALRALYKHPYLDPDDGMRYASGHIAMAGEPTADGLRAAENWPSPDGLVNRLVAALEVAADDESLPAEERGVFKRTALFVRGAAYQVVLGALGGATGNIISG